MKNFANFTLLIAVLGLFLIGCQEAPNPTEVQNAEEGKISLTKPGAVLEVPGDYTTIADAIAAANDGDRIMVGPGEFAGALVDKAVEIKGIGGATINDGPVHSSGLIQGFRLMSGSDGCTISHLTFTTDLSIINGEAVDDVTVTHCTFLNSIQAISQWRGSGWEISHNTITDLHTSCGGGIGILVADYLGGTVENNVVSHNTITGTLYVPSGDCGGYNGSGIVLYADFRGGGAGADEIKNNRVVKNNVSMVADDPGATGVDIVAFELTDTRDDINADPYPVIFDNSIGFNDWRGTTLQMVFTPEELEGENNVSRNLGNNRGHGLHPSLFGPGGN